MGGCGALGGIAGSDTQGGHRAPEGKGRHRQAQQSPAYLILGEQDQPGHQDIDNIAQTRVLEKFGNLTSKKQEKRSLKNELCVLGRAGHCREPGLGSEHNNFGRQGWEWDSTPPLEQQNPPNHGQSSLSPNSEGKIPEPRWGSPQWWRFVQPRGWRFAEGRPQHPPGMRRPRRVFGAVSEQMKRFQPGLFENLASALEMQSVKSDPAEDGTKSRHTGAFRALMENFQAHLTSQEDPARPIEAVNACSPVSAPRGGISAAPLSAQPPSVRAPCPYAFPCVSQLARPHLQC